MNFGVPPVMETSMLDLKCCCCHQNEVHASFPRSLRAARQKLGRSHSLVGGLASNGSNRMRINNASLNKCYLEAAVAVSFVWKGWPYTSNYSPLHTAVHSVTMCVVCCAISDGIMMTCIVLNFDTLFSQKLCYTLYPVLLIFDSSGTMPRVLWLIRQSASLVDSPTSTSSLSGSTLMLGKRNVKTRTGDLVI